MMFEPEDRNGKRGNEWGLLVVSVLLFFLMNVVPHINIQKIWSLVK